MNQELIERLEAMARDAEATARVQDSWRHEDPSAAGTGIAYRKQAADLRQAIAALRSSQERVEALEGALAEIETVAGMAVMATAHSRLDRVYRIATKAKVSDNG